MSNYKDTLNMPTTAFEMKANLNVKEPNIQAKWIEQKIYQKLLKRNFNNSHWILHDGPPYANGDIHLGHALNKIIKDIIVRYHTMNGEYSPYIPGWDTHGLPIEHALIKLGINKGSDLTVSQKRDNCKEFAKMNVLNQMRQFKRLGMLTDFEDVYLTYDLDYEKRQLEVFKSMVKQNLIFQDLKPVYWSWSSQTALADAEIEYAEVKSPSIYVSFAAATSNKFIDVGDRFVIWTTTPWTIPSNLAIAVNPKIVYVKIKVNNQNLIISKNRINDLKEILQWENYSTVCEFTGSDIEGLIYTHPMYDRKSPIILANYVSDEDGTGLVHNAPGFGSDDYITCKKYGIKVFCPIDNYGKFTSEINDDKLIGVFYDDANKIIAQILDNKKALLKLDFLKHSVAHDWRTKKPVIYRATKQWFVNIDQIQNKLKSALESVNFSLEWVETHMKQMIEKRTEWCISRQRIWGVPIPIIYDDQSQPIMDLALIENIIQIIGAEGTNIWFEKPVEYFLTKKYLASNKKYTKEKDIMDVWFDSGVSHTILSARHLGTQAQLYFEGSDQFRGWFNSSLITSVILNNQAPFTNLLSHGFILDDKGQKMSKSLGNVIDPIKVCQEFGADILRLQIANSNFQEDVKMTPNALIQTSEIYRRIRNTLFRFILANLSDFDINKNQNINFDLADKYVLNQLNENLKQINNWYKTYDFLSIIKLISNHTIEFSSWYFDLIKDTLYCEAADNQKRRVIQTVLYYILWSYLIVLTPIIPHTCEEVYTFLNVNDKKASINMENWIVKLEFDLKVNQVYWDQFFKIKTQAYIALEKLRNEKIINKSNEAILLIDFDNTINKFTADILAKYLNVAKVIINDNPQNKSILVKGEKSNFKKCERCWNYFETEKMYSDDLCLRCQKVIK